MFADGARFSLLRNLNYAKANGVSYIDISVINPFLSVQIAQHFLEQSVNFKNVKIVESKASDSIVPPEFPLVVEVEIYF